ncbi:MAG: hypothetical protein WC807_00435 [Hyphomicrobium sp.]|jgi:chromosome segregation ATPase
MVQPVKDKAKRLAARPARASGASDSQEAGNLQALVSRVSALEAERDTLKRELEAARQRIAALEESRVQVANRIETVIGSLTTLSVEKE